MGIEDLNEIRRKMLVVQQSIQEEGNRFQLEMFVDFLGSLKSHSSKGRFFFEYNSLIGNENIVQENLDIMNRYLIKSGEELFTKEDIEKVYDSFKK